MRAFLTAQWRDLLMVNYAVDPALLLPHVPRGTTLDPWRGDALVSVVGFRFVDTRLLGVPVPFHRTFDEVNLRFYVRRETPTGVRRAVVFVSELVPRRAIAWTARLAYNEPYRALPMRHAITGGDGSRQLRYEWRVGPRWTHVAARTRGPCAPLEPGSDAEFITEHYWGYTRQRDGGTVEYQVAHAPWRVWAADSVELAGDLTGTYGPEFAAVLSGTPHSAFVAEGSPVTVFRPVRLR
ncbi:MAG: DUF2071 domain-containing protein [Gemmatimonadaceae bacterium]|nr:DUF2071 domain-containing protein [Gemmatimonadaceae bacterium]